VGTVVATTGSSTLSVIEVKREAPSPPMTPTCNVSTVIISFHLLK
jgi:hypothetical protein